MVHPNEGPGGTLSPLGRPAPGGILADPEHVAIAKAGPNAISRWREATFWVPNEQPIVYHLNYSLGDRSTGETFERDFVHGRAKLDLSGAFLSGVRLPRADLAHDDLSRADLTGANLQYSRLMGTNLQSAHISRANLSHTDLTLANMPGCTLIRSDLSSSHLGRALLTGANLSYSDLQYVNLEGANLSGANLAYTDLSWANLSGANLRGANLASTSLKLADLTGADLRGASFSNADLESAVFLNATLGLTRLVNCDLSMVIGLDMASHSGPSAITLDTIARSGGMIPRAFLASAGVAEPLLAAQDVMRGVNRTYPTTLIIGSMNDSDLATRLRSGLAESHIPAWALAADDEAAVQSGQILFEHTPYFDCLVLLCTAESLESPQASTYLAQLAGGQRTATGQTLLTVAADEVFYQRDDQLCSLLKGGSVLDFRGWEDASAFGESLASLTAQLSSKTF